MNDEDTTTKEEVQKVEYLANAGELTEDDLKGTIEAAQAEIERRLSPHNWMPEGYVPLTRNHMAHIIFGRTVAEWPEILCSNCDCAIGELPYRRGKLIVMAFDFHYDGINVEIGHEGASLKLFTMFADYYNGVFNNDNASAKIKTKLYLKDGYFDKLAIHHGDVSDLTVYDYIEQHTRELDLAMSRK